MILELSLPPHPFLSKVIERRWGRNVFLCHGQEMHADLLMRTLAAFGRTASAASPRAHGRSMCYIPPRQAARITINHGKIWIAEGGCWGGRRKVRLFKNCPGVVVWFSRKKKISRPNSLTNHFITYFCGFLFESLLHLNLDRLSTQLAFSFFFLVLYIAGILTLAYYL